MCFFTGSQHQGFSRGHGIIMDKHYRTVKVIEAYGAGTSSDMHEFKMTPYSDGTSVLMTVYQPRQYDLTTHPKFNVKGGMGWIAEGVFQEIDIETGRLLFEWRSLDHIDPGEVWTWPHSTDTSGDGTTEWHPWDYFHLNSIDKNREGDYLLSARHSCAIYKISGKDGSIIWRMGGSKPDFEQTNFIFSYQHHARWISENDTHSVISFYDNGANGFNFSSQHSHGLIVEIDHMAKKATMLKKWGAPESSGGVRAGSQGSMQILEDGNIHIGWGEKAFFSEHTPDGIPVMYGKLAKPISGVPSYRSGKYNWTGVPLTKPALWTFSKYGMGKMAFYVSWNGATEVRSWNFFTSESSSGPWTYVGNEEKIGFETLFWSTDSAGWAYAQALDARGRVLEESVIAKAFVPSEKLRKHCGDGWCEDAQKVKTEDSDFKPFEDVFEVDQQYLENYASPNRQFDTRNYYHSNGTSDTIKPDYDYPEDDTYDSPKPNPAYMQGTHRGDLYVGPNSIALIIGMMIGFIAAVFLSCLYSIGIFRRFEPVVDRVSRRAFGFRHRYHRIRGKDDDSYDSGGRSSDNDAIPL